MRKSHRSDRSHPAAPSSAPRTNLKRRGFLLALGAGGVGAGAVAAHSVTGGSALEPEAAAAPAGGKGYALTEHVQRYYRTMKV